jgi:hypothetical protein
LGKFLECLAMKAVGKYYVHSAYLLPFHMYIHMYFMAIWSIHCNFIYFMAIWYILWSFWYSFPVLVCCNRTNLATLKPTCPNKRSLSSWCHFFSKFVHQCDTVFQL